METTQWKLEQAGDVHTVPLTPTGIDSSFGEDPIAKRSRATLELDGPFWSWSDSIGRPRRWAYWAGNLIIVMQSKYCLSTSIMVWYPVFELDSDSVRRRCIEYSARRLPLGAGQADCDGSGVNVVAARPEEF